MDITYFYLCNRYYLFYAINRHRPFDFPQISVQRYYFFPIYTNYFAFFSLLLDSRLYFHFCWILVSISFWFQATSKTTTNNHPRAHPTYRKRPLPLIAYTQSAVNLENDSKTTRRKDEERSKKERVKYEQNTATRRQRHGNKSKEKADKEQRRSRENTGDAGKTSRQVRHV